MCFASFFVIVLWDFCHGGRDALTYRWVKARTLVSAMLPPLTNERRKHASLVTSNTLGAPDTQTSIISMSPSSFSASQLGTSRIHLVCGK